MESVDALKFEKAASLVLDQKLPFYRSLDDEGKQKFLDRLSAFLQNRNISGREGLDVTPEMAFLACAPAVQLCFGLEEYLLPHFHTVILYPGEYTSGVTQARHKGETHPGGAVVFSWKDVGSGLADDTDGISLGLHEWAHALYLQNNNSRPEDEDFARFFPKWKAEAEKVRVLVLEGRNGLFRSYGGVSTEEFFAVCMEVFFEKPAAFAASYPELFRYTCTLLNQYPQGRIEWQATPIEVPTSAEIPFSKELEIRPGPVPVFRYLIPSILISVIILSAARFQMHTSLWYGIGAVFLVSCVIAIIEQWPRRTTIRLLSDSMEVLRPGRPSRLYPYKGIAVVEFEIRRSGVRMHLVYPQGRGVGADDYPIRFRSADMKKIKAFLQEKKIPVKLVRYRMSLAR